MIWSGRLADHWQEKKSEKKIGRNFGQNFDQNCRSKFLWFSSKSGFFRKFSIFSQNPETISHFFTFWDGFFMDFQFFLCFVKRTCPLLIRILYLFMKCASKCSIIEIYRNGTKKVSFGWIFPIHLPISSELSSWPWSLYCQKPAQLLHVWEWPLH